MKGPGLRIDLDVRRIWRCSKCGKTARTPGHVTAQRCGCSDEFPWMQLELPPKREPFRPPEREPLPEFGEEDPTPAPPQMESEQALAATVTTEPPPPPPAEPSISDGPSPPAAAPNPDPVPPVVEAAHPDEFGAGLSPATESNATKEALTADDADQRG